MKRYQLVLRNISGNSFRSWVVALCSLLIASFALATILILRGAENSLKLAIDRLGADIIVVPEGASSKVESALLMGNPAQVWMPRENLAKVAAIHGVQSVSPQLYLTTLSNASCCSVADMFLIVFDPKTDFTIEPWLEKTIGNGLRQGEVVGGRYIFVPSGEQNIKIYGYFVTLKANLGPTGTGLDQSMFMTMDTAQDISRLSHSLAEKPLEIPADSISSVMVKLDPGVDPYAVSVDIMHNVPGVTPIESPNLFQSTRSQMRSLLSIVLIIILITLALSILLIGLVFSMAANERRRELGVLRAMGATRGFVFQSILSEAILLALAGGVAGIGITSLAIYLFHNLLVSSLGIPFLLPSPLSLVIQVVMGLGLALLSVSLAALLPAYRISHLDPAIAMRE